MNLPPPELVAEKLRDAVAPAFAAAVVVLAPFLIMWRRRLAPVGSALAFLAGVAAANHFCVALPWEPDRSNWERLLPAAVAVTLAGLATRVPRVPALAGWLLRAAAAGAAGWFVMPDAAHFAERCALGAIILGEWAVLETLARRLPGGSVPLGAGLALFAGAAVLIHAHSARLTDAATFAGAALMGIAVAASLRRGDVGGAMPGVAVLLPGLLAWGQNETYSEVPAYSFIVAGLAPLALAPLLIPAAARMRPRWQLVAGAVLLLIPLAVAVAGAARAESLEFG